MKKHIFIISLLSIVFNLNAQDIPIAGTVYQMQHKYLGDFDNFIEVIDTVETNDYDIYLISDLKGSKKRKILKSKTSKFNVSIKKKTLKKFPYLEFYSKKEYSYKKVKIDSLKTTDNKIILEKMPVFTAKPVIYLYPLKETQISLKIDIKGGKLETTYPEYKNGWNLIADKTGNILNVEDNRNYQYLFWDAFIKFPSEHFNYTSGFFIDKKDYISFLQNTLGEIGLNEKEINDFISYWLPQLNKYNRSFVHFRVNDNIDNSVFLNCNPKPDTEIRVYMEFKDAENEINRKIPTQKFKKIERKGFTLIEWGGAEIKKL